MKKFKCLVSGLLAVTMLVITFGSSVSAIASANDLNDVQLTGVLVFDPEYDDVLEVFASANPAVDLSQATVSEELDSFGNVSYVIEISQETHKPEFSASPLLDIAPAFLDDPDVTAYLNGNTLYYVLPDGTEGKIIETMQPNGQISLLTIEGGVEIDVIIDSDTGEIFLDEELVEISITETFVVYEVPSFNSRSVGSWIFVGETSPNIQAERAIANLTTGTLVVLVSAAFGGVIGITISVAANIITFFNAMSSTATLFHARRRVYHFWDASEVQTITRFYETAARRTFITSETRNFFAM